MCDVVPSPPQTMSVKLQPASGPQLPAYNPLLPPPAISQVLLLANPQEVSPVLDACFSHRCSLLRAPLFDICPPSLQQRVRLRYRLALTRGDQPLNETGEIESLPDWAALIGR